MNLDVASGFSAVQPVVASDPVGPLTGIHYPSSLIRPDRLGFEPRVGISWRPIPASTIVVRAGYGIYDDTSVYQTSALQLAQQSPLSTSLSVQNSPDCPLTLANGFIPCSSITTNTFAVDPNFRVGYAQTWQLSVQRDLPGALQLTATYLGVKGTRGVQQFLPNTYPIGAASPCPDCPSGFVYQTSGGDSTRQSGQIQLRRRLRSGFTASLLYTYSKSIDDDAYLGGQGHVVASSQTAAPAAGQGSRGSGQGSGQGSSGTSATTYASHRPHRHRAELAQPACRALALHLRSTSPAQPASPIHQRRRPWWRNPDERLAWQAVQGVDGRWHAGGRHRPAGDADLLGSRPGNGLHRHHSTQPYRRAHLHLPAGRRISTLPPTARRCRANGEPRAGTRLPVPASSASTARSSERFGPADAFTWI